MKLKRVTAATELKALMLMEPRLTLAAAESLTCGRVQARIGEVSGASNYFLGGITAYSLEQKVRHLGVDRAMAKKVNAVSSAVAEEMARGACVLFGSEVGVATTGYAERSPADGVAEPFAWWAVVQIRQRGGKRRRGVTAPATLRRWLRGFLVSDDRHAAFERTAEGHARSKGDHHE